MTARIRPAILALATITTLLAALFLVFNQPARAVPVAPTVSTMSVTPATVCTTTGVCLLDESTPFTVTRPPAVLPAETPATVCTPGTCILDETTPFSVVR